MSTTRGDALYWELVEADVSVMHPSEALNLVDEARRHAPAMNEFYAEQVEAKCISIELDVHLTYTPAELALACCRE